MNTHYLNWGDFENVPPVNVLQGEYSVSNCQSTYFSTVLGSCVAVCLFDQNNNVGAMNHILLPGGEGIGGGHARYGVHLMELLINGVLRAGGERQNLTAKVFGGAQISEHNIDVGRKNVAFIRNFLSTESIACVSESVGGVKARKVQFVPFNGLARQLLIDPPQGLHEREAPKAPMPEAASDITLF